MKWYGLLFIFLFFIAFVLISGCGDYHPAYSRYFIVVRGIENYTSGGLTQIFVPVPIMNGSPIFNDSEMLNSTSITWLHSQWRPKLVTTEKGTMISLSTSEKTLTKPDLDLDKSHLLDLPLEDYENRSSILESILIAPYYPVANWSELNFTRVSSTDYKHNYTSYIYIDEKLQPVPGKDHTIEVYSKFEINEGSYSNVGKSYGVIIHEFIPEGVNGWVPVTVQVL